MNCHPDTIAKLLNTFTSTSADVALSFSFTLSDSLKVRLQDELIKNAVADSQSKASLIASSSGVSLKDIAHIEYSNGYQPDFGDGLQKVAPMSLNRTNGVAYGNASGFVSGKENFRDQVTVTWNIE